MSTRIGSLHRRFRRFPSRTVLLGSGLAIFLHWLAVGSHHVVEQALHAWHVPGTPYLVLGAALVFAYFCWRGLQRYVYGQVEIVSQGPARPHEGLILFLSTVGSTPWAEFENQLTAIPGDLTHADTRSALVRLRGWGPAFAAIARYYTLPARRRRLKKILVIASSGNDGSASRFDTFREQLQRLFPAGDGTAPDVEMWPAGGVAINDFEQLSHALNGAFRHLSEAGIHDVIVDITGGTKPWSAVAALLALDTSRTFQYVDTNDPTQSQITEYDIRSYHPVGH